MPIAQTQTGFRILQWEEDFQSFTTGAFTGQPGYIYNNPNGATVTIEPGNFFRTNVASGNSTVSLTKRGIKAFDYKASILTRHWGGTNEQGLFIGRSGPGENLQVRIAKIGSGAELTITDKGGIKAQIPFASSSGTWYHLEATVIGDQVSAIVKNQAQTVTLASTTITTTTLAYSTTVGMVTFTGTGGGQTDIDNFYFKAL